VGARTVVLLPPSEGKASGGRGHPWAPGTGSFPDLDEARARVLAALGSASTVADDPTLPAIERYTGVLYRELDAATLTPAGKRRLARQVLIVSGLWGLVGPRDPIPTYRLKMSARLDGIGRLSSWWRPQLTEVLAPRLRGAVVWDLLPIEHAAALNWDQLAPRRRVTARFLDANGRTVSHWNKLLKGTIVRGLAETGASDPAELAGFEHPQGYRFDPVSSQLDSPMASVVLHACS
jgi:cytoplasmic iron level regulating protein YaaA (DUF328/UPF0246 family)